MLDQLANLVTAVREHPLLLAVLFLVCFLGAIALFADGRLGAALEGMARIVGGIFTAPFRFLRKVIGQAIAYRDESAREAASGTFLLWTAVQVAYVLVFVAALALAASGVVVAAAGIWPTAQLAERKALKATEQETDSLIAAATARLDTLKGANADEQARQREARLATLQKAADSAEALDRVLTDSVNTVNAAKDAFIADVWPQIADSNFARAKVYVTAQLETFLAARKDSLPAPDLAQLRRFVRGRTTLAAARQELEALRATPDPAAEERTLRDGVEAARQRKEGIRSQLNNLAYFTGLKAFGVTLLATVLYFLAFVWAAGTAVESAALVVGMARDLAALRDLAAHRDRPGSGEVRWTPTGSGGQRALTDGRGSRGEVG